MLPAWSVIVSLPAVSAVKLPNAWLQSPRARKVRSGLKFAVYRSCASGGTTPVNAGLFSV
jgi:hypothetical protein